MNLGEFLGQKSCTASDPAQAFKPLQSSERTLGEEKDGGGGLGCKDGEAT